jgi:hypothetical protein
VEYLFFAWILALCRPINLTNPIRQLYTLVYSAYSCLIGLVVLICRLSAMNLAKSLIVLKNNYLNHRAPMQWNGRFWPKSSPTFASRLHRSIRYSTTKNAVYSYLRNGGFPLDPTFWEHAAEVRDSPNSKFLRIEMKNIHIMMTMGMYW